MVTHACSGCLRVTSRTGRCLACGGGTTTQRGYGAGWRLRRARQLLQRPRCQWLVTLPSTTCRLRATDVDHIMPKVHGGTDDAANLQSLCAAHHRVKTATQDRRWGSETFGQGPGGTSPSNAATGSGARDARSSPSGPSAIAIQSSERSSGDSPVEAQRRLSTVQPSGSAAWVRLQAWPRSSVVSTR